MKNIVCIDMHTIGHRSQYDVQSAFIRGMHHGLVSEGLDSSLILCNRLFPGGLIQELIDKRPDCTLSFNGVPYNDQNEQICQDLKLPNISVLIDAPFYFLHLLKTFYAIFTCYDRSDALYYRDLGYRLVFLPHAVEPGAAPDWAAERKYEVVMLASVIDPDEIRSEWYRLYPLEVAKSMDEAAEAALTTPGLNTHQAFLTAMRRRGHEVERDAKKMMEILKLIEQFYRGKDRIELVKSIRNVRVDIFGKGKRKGWSDLIHQENVVFHEAVDFGEAFKVMQQSKIVLNSSPMIKDGAHERVLYGLLSGSFVLSSYSKYLSEEFPKGCGIRFYQPGSYGTVESVVGEILSDELLRVSEAMKGYGRVIESHTWKSRAKVVHEVIGPIVDEININRS